MKNESATLFGIDIAIGTKEELLSLATSLIGRGGAISTVNPEIMRDSVYNATLRAALMESLNIPDGVGVRASLSMKGIKTEVFPGVELGEALLDIPGVRFAIIGGKSGVAKRALEKLSLLHPGSVPCFAMDGYTLSYTSVGEQLTEYLPQLVFVCLGSPKQEIFIYNIKRYAKETLFLSLGGSVDIYAQDKKRAPRVVRKMKCEWLYRMIREPSRISRVPKLADFAYFSLIEALNNRKNR